MPDPQNLLLMALRRTVALSRAAEFLFKRADASGDVFPDDAAQGQVTGPDADRVLFLGEPGMLTLGVRTHELSLAAFAARHLARGTSRGVEWSIRTLPSSRIAEAPRVVAALECDLMRVDAIVLLVGITDVLRVTSPVSWERHLSATLDALEQRVPQGTRILVAEIPPLDNAGSLSRPARLAAGIHGRLLNRRSRTLVEERADTCVVPFPEELTQSVWRPESDETRYTGTYRVWGAQMSRMLQAHALRS